MQEKTQYLSFGKYLLFYLEKLIFRYLNGIVEFVLSRIRKHILDTF